MSMSVHIFLSCMQMCQSRFRYCLCLYNISDVYVYCVFIYKLLFLSFPPFCPLAFSIFLLLELVNKNIDFCFLWTFGISWRTCKFSFHFAAVPALGVRPKRLWYAATEQFWLRPERLRGYKSAGERGSFVWNVGVNIR